MKDFEQAVKFVLEHETVYAKGHYGDLKWAVPEDEDADPGGLTKYGIDQASHPDVDIDKLTLEEATSIYQRLYWDKNHCGEMPWPLSLIHFDACVNMGAGQAVKFLQRAAQASDDGAWGPATKKALNDALDKLGAKILAKDLCDQREAFYCQLARNKPQLSRFLKGWVIRVDDLRKECELY
jgi:lysozyme family protein